MSQKLAALSDGEGHAARADLGGEDEVAEAGLWRRRQHEEEHDGAVDGDQGEVVFGQDGAVEGNDASRARRGGCASAARAACRW